MGQSLKTSITLDVEILEWLDRKVADKTFASRSHGIEFCIQRCMEADKRRGDLFIGPAPP